MIVSNKLVTNQTIALMHILQKRNFTNSAKLSGKSLNYPKDDQKKCNSFLFIHQSIICFCLKLKFLFCFSVYFSSIDHRFEHIKLSISYSTDSNEQQRSC
jgi:hypothetical protein